MPPNMRDVATIQIPATTANLAPVSIAWRRPLKLHNAVTSSARDDGKTELTPMANEAAAAFFGTAGLGPFQFHCHIDGDVPRSRGLGSSVTVRLGLLHGLNELEGRPLSDRRLFEICAALEGTRITRRRGRLGDSWFPGREVFSGLTWMGGWSLFCSYRRLRWRRRRRGARLPAQVDRLAACEAAAMRAG